LKTTLLTVGRARPPFAAAEAHYRKMLGRRLPLELIEVRDDGDLERRVPSPARVAALDRGGLALDSLGWSRWLGERRIEARDLCFVVGGPAGIPAALLDRADDRISFGPHTMAHQLARVVLLEQLFRATKILAGEPYHL
jgi:23S rRNA (pseudouridine1915-N3)-methyltransferase